MRYRTLTILLLPLLLADFAPAQGLSSRIRQVQAKRQAAQRDALVQAGQPEPGSHGHMLQKLLFTTVSVDFIQEPARAVIEHLSQQADVRIVGRYLDDSTGVGIDPLIPITIAVEDGRLLSVLEQILEQCALLDETTWQLRKGFVEIGTKARLNAPAARVTRSYPIAALLHEPPMFDDAPDLRIETSYANAYSNWGSGWRRGYGGSFGAGGTGFSSGGGYGGVIGSNRQRSRSIDPGEAAQEIIDLITSLIEPAHWAVNGGDAASIRYLQGVLVINAPDYIHRQVAGYPRVPPPTEPEAERDGDSPDE